MIINAGERTDLPQWYPDWMQRRFEEGYVLVRNPLYPQKVSHYVLDPSVVDCVVFWSKNFAPLLPRLTRITDRFNTYFHFTITCYGSDIEPGVPSLADAVETLYDLERLVGRGRICWRYDPVLLTSAYTPERHLATFAWLAERLAGHVDRCVFSFVEVYRKLEHNFPNLLVPSLEERDIMAEGMARIAHDLGIRLQTCGRCGDLSRYGIGPSACVDTDVLGAANGVRLAGLRRAGKRVGCGCHESRDIGCYDSCPNGCRYCYANRNPALAQKNRTELHDPTSPLLLGHLEPGDEVMHPRQRSVLVRSSRKGAEALPGQLTLFDAFPEG